MAKIVDKSLVDVERPINQWVKSGTTGVILNDNDEYELVYFSDCHCRGSSGRIPNTLTYCQIGDDGLVLDKQNYLMYRYVFDLKKPSKVKMTTYITLED